MRIVLAYVIKPLLFCHTVVVGHPLVSFSTTHHTFTTVDIGLKFAKALND